MAYSSETYGSSNPFRRYAHNSRFKFSAKLVEQHIPKDGTVLDYGSGDGHFLDVLAERGIRATGYDPLPIIRRHDVVSSLPGGGEPFDCITCLETLEHITDEKLSEFFGDIEALLRPSGVAIISVPVMIGPVVLLKSLPAVIRGNDRPHGYTWGALFGAVIGRPPHRHLDPEHGIYYHMGFDHRSLRTKIREKFTVTEIASPFSWAPVVMNSQIFFVCRRNRDTRNRAST